MKFDDYIGQELLVRFANLAVPYGNHALKVKLLGSEPGGIWIGYDDFVSHFGLNTVKLMTEEGHSGCLFYSF